MTVARKYPVSKVLALVRDDAGRVLLGNHYIENWVPPNGDQISTVMLVRECEVLRGEPRPDGQEILECR